MINNIQAYPEESTGRVWQDLLLDAKEHRNLILVFFLCTALGTYITLQLITAQYESHASLLVKLGRENVEVPSTVEKGGVLSTGVRLEEINSEVRLLTSRSLIEATIDEMGLSEFRREPAAPNTVLQYLKFYVKMAVRAVKDGLHSFLVFANLAKDLDERDKVVLGLQKALKVERQKDSDVIGVTVQLPDPELAMRVLDTLIRLFRDRHIEVRRNAPMQEFFATQVRTYREQISTIEQAKERLRKERQLGFIDQQRRQLQDQLHRIEEEQTKRQSELTLLSRAAASKKPLKGEPVTNTAQTDGFSLSFAPIRERITQLRIERTKLAGLYDPTSQVIRNLNEELATLEGSLADNLKANIGELRAQAKAIREELVTLNAAETKLSDLERRLKISENNYSAYEKRMEDARVSEELDLHRVLNISILDPPSRPIEPVSPRMLLIMGISLPLGLFLGIVIALMIEYLNGTVRTYRDLASIEGLAYLGTFRQFPDGRYIK